MRKIQVMLLALVAVFALSAIAASGASATQWFLNGVLIPVGVKAAVNSKDVGKVSLSDMKGGIFGEEITVSCEGTDKGTVENSEPKPGEVVALDFESEVTATECTTTKGTCEAKPKVEAVNLPWHTIVKGANDELLVEAGKVPGYKVTCAFGVNDKCEAETTVPLPWENLATDVDLNFTQAESENHPGKCERGGAKQGLVVGKVLILDPGGTLQLK